MGSQGFLERSASYRSVVFSSALNLSLTPSITCAVFDLRAFQVFSPAFRMLLTGPRFERGRPGFPAELAFFTLFGRLLVCFPARFLAVPFFPERLFVIVLSR